jgi:hypothetical protein
VNTVDAASLREKDVPPPFICDMQALFHAQNYLKCCIKLPWEVRQLVGNLLVVNFVHFYNH